MLTRKPFLSLLGVTGLGLALIVALVVVTVPAPVHALVTHCIDAAGACQSVLEAVRTDASPLVLVLLLLSLAWSAQRGLGEALRQWRATRAALDVLRGDGCRIPAGALADHCAAAGVAGYVDVVVVDHPLALCHGLWRPRIWLSTGALAVLGAAELRALLGHERVHRQRRDPLRLLLARALAAAFPHLPVLRELAATLPLTQELAADRAVIRAGARDALGRALLTIVEGSGALEVPAVASGMASCLDARIDQLTGAPVVVPDLSRRALVRTAAALGLGMLLLATLVVSQPPLSPPGPPPGMQGNPPSGAPPAPGIPPGP